MNDKFLKIESVLEDLAGYFVSKYGMTASEADGLVRGSAVAKIMAESGSALQDFPVEQLAAATMLF